MVVASSANNALTFFEAARASSHPERGDGARPEADAAQLVSFASALDEEDPDDWDFPPLARQGSKSALQVRRQPTSSCPRSGNFCYWRRFVDWHGAGTRRNLMNGLIYLVGLIVVILAILSFFGLR